MWSARQKIAKNQIRRGVETPNSQKKKKNTGRFCIINAPNKLKVETGLLFDYPHLGTLYLFAFKWLNFTFIIARPCCANIFLASLMHAC